LFEAVDATTARDHCGVAVDLVEERLRYRNAERTLFVPLEYLYGEEEVVIYASSIRTWEVPNALEAIGSIERVQILGHIAAALDVLGVKFRIEG
jgi:hypothetical protein